MNGKSQHRKLIAALAVRNQGSRLYGKPLQNLDVKNGIMILDNIIDCLNSISCIDEIVLGISEGVENEIFVNFANQNNLKYIIGNEIDVLSRLISCGDEADATDIFRVTSESPFPSFELVGNAWSQHVEGDFDATFLDDVVDGCGFEIIKLKNLVTSHFNGEDRHRSELCTLYIRENIDKFIVKRIESPIQFIRKDLRLTVDNPEDLIVCKEAYNHLKHYAPRIPLEKIIDFLDGRPELIALTMPFTEQGYASMYRWTKNEEK